MHIKDVIHGMVTVPELCRKFIDVSEFDRLRRIKQLGLVFYVYPSAVHTRFEHCIGVMHLSGVLCDRLGVSGREKELVQLAGLYHDIGHVALSHLYDYVLEEKDTDNPFKHHEYRSIRILMRVNDRLKLLKGGEPPLTEEEVEFVKKCILGGDTYKFQIVKNKQSGLDADRMDYLSRDMYHLKLSQFHPDYIISSMCVKDGVVAVQEKARCEVELLYDTRKRLLLYICRHKTVMKVEKLWREILKELALPKFDDSFWWLKLDDWYLYVVAKERLPVAIEMLENRRKDEWKEVLDSEKYAHITDVKREDIERQLSKVIYA